jgi:hypothetical protein
MPRKNERIASIPVNTSFLVALLTDPRIKVSDNRSEYDDGQLDGLAPFGPLRGIKVSITCSVTSFWAGVV